MLYILARSPTNSCGAKLEHSSFILPRTLAFVLEWRGWSIVRSVICIHVVRHILVEVGRLDVMYKRVRICVGQFGTRSVLAQNFLVMEFIHCYFWQFKYAKPEIDRSIDDYFWFLFFNWYEIICDDVPVECGRSGNELFLGEWDLLPVLGPFVFADSPSSFPTAYYSDFCNEPVKMRNLRLVSSRYWSLCRALSTHSVWISEFGGL